MRTDTSFTSGRWIVLFGVFILVLTGGCKEEPSPGTTDTQVPVEDVADTTDTTDTADTVNTVDAADTAVPEDVADTVDTGVPEDTTIPNDTQDTADGSDGSGSDIPPVGDTQEPPNACLPVGQGPGFQVSARADLRWKRERALERDLLQTLELSAQEVCGEVGIAGSCFNLVHRVPLGGNDPVYAAMYQPIERPGLTSAIAIDRVTVAACGRRVDLDSMAAKGGKNVVVFTALDFLAASVSSSDSVVSEQITILYRRILGRDASAQELAILSALAKPLPTAPDLPVTPREFAKALCFAIATTSEALLH